MLRNLFCHSLRLLNQSRKHLPLGICGQPRRCLSAKPRKKPVPLLFATVNTVHKMRIERRAIVFCDRAASKVHDQRLGFLALHQQSLRLR